MVYTKGEEGELSSAGAHNKEGPCRIQQEGGCLQVRKRALTRPWPYRHSDLGLLASTSVRKLISVFKSPSLWYFVVAAQAEKDNAQAHLF